MRVRHIPSKWDEVPPPQRTQHSAPQLEILTTRKRSTTPWSRVQWDEPTDDPQIVPDADEFIVQKNRQVRQAGSDRPDGPWVQQVKTRAERSLYVFGKSILKRRYFIPTLHLKICNWLQARRPDPDRKCLEVFREMGKTSIVSHAVPLHVQIQPQSHNVWFPGESGREQRILLVKEAIDLAMDELRVVKSAAEENELLRALWPDCFWDDPRRQAKRWSNVAIIHPRNTDWPDASLRAMGVGGAIAGKHPSMLIKDDIISFDAANSPTEMETTIRWHLSSRALINKPGCLELILGTPWAIHDVYSFIESTDNRLHGGTVEFYKQPLIEPDGTCVYPEFSVTFEGSTTRYGFSKEKMDGIRTTKPQEWLLQYMISVVDPDMVDFTEEALRWYTIEGGNIHYVEDARDAMLEDLERTRRTHPSLPAHRELSKLFDDAEPTERRRHMLRSRMVA